MRTLITGGFGFLAAWTAAGLRAEGHHVLLADNAPFPGSPAWLAGLHTDPRVTVLDLDITVPEALDKVGPVDHVIHAAAVVGVNRVAHSSLRTLHVNIDGTRAVLDYATRCDRLKRLVLLSTSEVYGPQADGAAEDHWHQVRCDHPRWIYGVSKTAAEALAYAYGAEHGLPFTVVRPFNVYGPLQTNSGAVIDLAKKAVTNQPLVVHGDGRQARAWCHVEDFTRGILLCLATPEAQGEAINLGDDRNVLPMLELAHRIRRLAGGTSPLNHAPAPGPDITTRSPDMTKARRILGHQPTRDLDDGLRHTIAWARHLGAHPITFPSHPSFAVSTSPPSPALPHPTRSAPPSCSRTPRLP